MSLSDDATGSQGSPEVTPSPAAVVVRSFWLAASNSGAKSFRLAPFFSARRPVSPGVPAEQRPGTEIRSFHLAPLKSNVRSFQLVRTSEGQGEVVLHS